VLVPKSLLSCLPVEFVVYLSAGAAGTFAGCLASSDVAERHCSQVVVAFAQGPDRHTLFFGGLAKINGDWLHGQPMGIGLTSQSEFPLIGRFLTQAWCAYLFSYGGMLFDLLVVPLLLWRRSRWITLLVVIGFHLLNASLFNIGYFPWLMLLATALVFVPPE
jgi:hypothetical protein